MSLALNGPGLDELFSGATSSGKKNQGVFSTGWLQDLADGDYTAEVTGLTHADYPWAEGLAPNGNTAQHSIPH